MMAGVLVSPGLDDAVRKRNSNYKKRGGSPSFKEILRKRCQERFKARRGALLNQFRQLEPGAEDVRQIISSMVREEVRVLSAGDRPLDTLDEEGMELDIQPLDKFALNDFEGWLLNEYDRLMEEQLEEDVGLLDQQICPLCLSSPLIEGSRFSTCGSCQVHLPPLERLLPSLDSAYEAHSSTQCCSLPACSVVQRSLYLVCLDCSNILFITELVD